MCTYSFGVMIVDDSEADVETITRSLLALASPPCVLVCRTAGEALEALHTHPELIDRTVPFVILVEANLPLISGVEFVACMRCDASLSRIPVFVLARSRSDCEHFAAHDLGIAGCLRKPTLPGESEAIAARIAAYARGGSSADRSRQRAHSRARAVCLPYRVGGTSKAPALQRRSTTTSAG